MTIDDRFFGSQVVVRLVTQRIFLDLHMIQQPASSNLQTCNPEPITSSVHVHDDASRRLPTQHALARRRYLFQGGRLAHDPFQQ